jgi:hypothetical protein
MKVFALKLLLFGYPPRSIRVVWKTPFLLAAMVMPALAQQATETRPDSPNSATVDELLLEGLEEVLEVSDDVKPALPVNQPDLSRVQGGVESSAVDGPRSALSLIAEEMASIGPLLERARDPRKISRRQEFLVRRMDELLAALDSEQGDGSSETGAASGNSSAETGGAPNAQASQSSDKLAGEAAGEVPNAATDSGEGSVQSAEPAPASIERQVWGHLPARIQRSLRHVTPEDFAPEYRRRIEDYYRRLARDSGNR